MYTYIIAEDFALKYKNCCQPITYRLYDEMSYGC